MSSNSQIAVPEIAPLAAPAKAQWFAVQTRSRHEKRVVAALSQRGINTFLPLLAQLRRWSDRRKMVEFPLFPGYAFVHIPLTPQTRVAVLNTHGVVSFVGPHGQATPIPTDQIEDLRTLVLSDVAVFPRPFIKIGQRVRVRGGALDGVEGILTGTKGDRQLVLSIEAIQRSVSISLEGYDLEPV